MRSTSKLLVTTLTLTVLCAMPIMSHAGSFTITSTADQDEAMTRIVSEENARRQALSPPLPSLSNAEYVQILFTKVLESYRTQTKRRDDEIRRTQFNRLSPTLQNRVKNLLECGKDACP